MQDDARNPMILNDIANQRSAGVRGAVLAAAVGAPALKAFQFFLTVMCAAAVVQLVGVTRPSAQTVESQSLILEDKIVLGDVLGRIDHMAFDSMRNRLIVAELENNTVAIVDLQRRKVIHVIVRLFRAGDFAETGRIELGEDADNIRMDLAANRILVGYGSGAIAVIDAAKRTKIGDLPLPAHPEGFQLDHTTNQIFVNVPNSNAIVVLDGLTGQHKATWPLNETGRNFPMAIDDAARRVLVGFRSPARLGAFSIGNGQNVASIELCGDTDDIFVDAKRHCIYASCGQGFLDVFEAREGGFRRSLRLPTVPGARTSYFVASIDRLFLAVRSTAAEPAAIWMFRPAP